MGHSFWSHKKQQPNILKPVHSYTFYSLSRMKQFSLIEDERKKIKIVDIYPNSTFSFDFYLSPVLKLQKKKVKLYWWKTFWST